MKYYYLIMTTCLICYIIYMDFFIKAESVQKNKNVTLSKNWNLGSLCSLHVGVYA